MFEFIRHLQQKPESARRRWAFSLSLIVTLVIVGVWLSTLPSRVSSERRARVENTDVTPLRSLGETFSKFFSGTTEQFQQIRDDGAASPSGATSTPADGEEAGEGQATASPASLEADQETSSMPDESPVSTTTENGTATTAPNGE